MRYKKGSKVISFIMAVVLAFSAVVFVADFGAVTVEASRIGDLERQIQENQREANAIQRRIDGLRGDVNRAVDLQIQLQSQVDNTQTLINNAEALLREVESDINRINGEISEIETAIENNTELFRRRMRAMYMTGNTTGLELILGATDLEEFVMQTELMRNVARQDYDLLVEMRENLVNVNNLRRQAENRRVDAQNTRNMLANRRQELRAQIDAQAAVASSLQGDIATEDARRRQLYNEMAAHRRQIENIVEQQRRASQANNNPIVWNGTQFVWPVPSHHTVSSPFGMRWGRLHGGIDIAGPGISGRAVVAAADGVVVTSSSGWNGGYGTLVVIDHGRSATSGRTYDTWYAHLSSRSVQPGQRVTAGQTIGTVGNTGDSTGPHLHFEIRVNNVRVNPMNFFSR